MAPIPRISILLASATGIAYEILLIRLFSIVQWHHFAYMIISLALLGYGASGTFLTLSRSWWKSRFASVFLVNLGLFSVSMPICYLLAQDIPFHPDEMLWHPTLLIHLLAIYLLLALPFFFLANAIGLALSRYSTRGPLIYAADLTGAGLGAIGIVLALFVLLPAQVLPLLSTLGITATMIALLELQAHRRRLLLPLLIIGISPWVLPGSWFEPAISSYKGLQQTLRIAGTRMVEEVSSPLGVVSVLESSEVPLRHAPGMSLRATVEPPDQVGLFIDAEGPTVITRDSGDPAALDYLDQLTSSLPYYLKQNRKVLVLGAGGGGSVLQAIRHGAYSVDAVELNPQIVQLVDERYAAFSGNLYSRPEVRVHIGDARGYSARSNKQYDLVQLPALDSGGTSSAGFHALNENYLFTLEAMQDYYQMLSPDGYLSIGRWVRLPPRDTLKLFNMAVQTLRDLKVAQPGNHLILIRDWQTSLLLIKKSPFNTEEIESARLFCAQRNFDLAFYPGILPAEANRFNKLAAPYFYQAAIALLDDQPQTFISDYKFDIRPATDNRPYFFHFFKWRTLTEIWRLSDEGGMPLLDSGYLVLIATLLQALVASVILILLPLWVLRRKQTGPQGSNKTGVFLYFAAIGMAFMFLEMAYIQRFIQYLHHPVYSVAVVLCAFLVFAGTGSAFSEYLAARLGNRKTVALAVAAILIFGSLYLLLLPPVFQHTLTLNDPLRILIALALIAPLAFFMGMPFPMALASLSLNAADQVPWAWGVNGCASVVSAVLATLAAIHLGFSLVVLAALGLYLVAYASFPDQNR